MVTKIKDGGVVRGPMLRSRTLECVGPTPSSVLNPTFVTQFLPFLQLPIEHVTLQWMAEDELEEACEAVHLLIDDK
jgi:hypothetical protein